MKTAQRILATALLIPVLTYTTRADVITQWTFETSIPLTAGPFTPEVGSSLGAASLTHAGASVYSSPVGNGSSHSFSSNTWAVGDYYQFTTNVTGFQDLVLKWDQTSSGTGPRDFDLQYTTDGTTYLTVPGFDNYVVLANTSPPNTAWTGSTVNPAFSFTADLSSIAALNNNANVAFRLKMDSTVSANQITPGTVAPTGTDRVDNFTVNGVTFFNSINNYWDTNGSTTGVGGNGTWTLASPTWNALADGTGPSQSLDPAGKAIFAGTGGTVVVGAGAVANGGIIFDSTGYTLTGSPLQIVNTGARIQVTNAADTATISAALTGSAGVAKTGAGTLILSGTNTYTGATTISAGVLQIAASTALGDAANPVVLAGGTLKTTSSVTLPGTRALSGTGALDIAPSTTLTVNGATTVGLITLANVGSLILSGSTSAPSVAGLTFAQAATVTVSGAALDIGSITTTHTTGTATIAATGGSVDFGTSSRTLNVTRGSAAVDLRFNSDVTNSGTGLLTKVGGGVLEFAGGSNSVGGIFQLGLSGSSTPASATQGGTVIIHDSTSLGNADKFRFNSGVVNNASGGTLTFPSIGISLAAGQLPGGATFEGSPFIFQGESVLFKPTGSSAYQHLITANADVTFDGGFAATVTTAAGLTITGSGRVFFPTQVKFLEPITVDGGKLFVTAGLTAATKPTITVINGGILGGDQASSLGPVVAQAGGIVAPGTPTTPTGTLNTLNFSVPAGGFLKMDVTNAASGDYDKINVTGTVTLGGGLSVTRTLGNTVTPGDQFLIILNDGADPITTAFTNLAENSIFATSDYAFRINYNVTNPAIGADGNDVVLTAVPEPASAALLLGGIGLLVARRRQRRS